LRKPLLRSPGVPPSRPPRPTTRSCCCLTPRRRARGSAIQHSFHRPDRVSRFREASTLLGSRSVPTFTRPGLYTAGPDYPPFWLSPSMGRSFAISQIDQTTPFLALLFATSRQQLLQTRSRCGSSCGSWERAPRPRCSAFYTKTHRLRTPAWPRATDSINPRPGDHEPRPASVSYRRC